MADMRYRRLGDSGLVVSVVGLGCNNFGRSSTWTDPGGGRRRARRRHQPLRHRRHLRRAGRSEEMLGEALKGRRDEVVLATKFGMDMGGANGRTRRPGSRRYIDARGRGACAGSAPTTSTSTSAPPDPGPRSRRPSPRWTNSSTRARSATSASPTSPAGRSPTPTGPRRAGDLTPFVWAQNNYSLLEREVEPELVPACERFGLGLLPFFPLANGLLTGKYRRGEAAAGGHRSPMAAGAGRLADAPTGTSSRRWRPTPASAGSLLDVAIGGLAAQPAVASVIAGATSARAGPRPTPPPARGCPATRTWRRCAPSSERGLGARPAA